MTQNNPPTDRPLEETPEVQAAVEDETTVPQLATGGGDDRSQFREPGEVPGDFPPTEDLIGDAYGAGSGGPGRARTGAEQPWDPEDLAAAKGRDLTPENIERARRELQEKGRAAIERTTP
ncbi:MAG TPA: hypothetical protein VFX61_17165 [Micromonosporaceae bacterium]|nr:hypothetical protein [Micromonosporaceae bacterium]